MANRTWNSDEFANLEVEESIIALAASAAQFAYDNGEGPIPEQLDEVQDGAPFRVPVLIPEEEESGDGRQMAKNSLSLRDLPIPLLWQPSTGDGHAGSFIVGRIDTVERIEGGLGNATGVFDTGPYGREAERLVRAKMLRGVSADLDQFEATVEGEPVEDISRITNERMIVEKARVMAATLVAKPAFQQCSIELTDESDMTEENAPLDDGVYEEFDEDVTVSALAASAAPLNPPKTWLQDPGLTEPTPLTIDDDGRVYGHIAAWSTDHIGYNQGVRAPKSMSNYAYFRTGLIRTAEGEDVAVGQLTLAGGHAPLDYSAQKTIKHYDDTHSAVADVNAGEDAFGIWVAGALRPGVTPEQVRALRASAPSGDWRPINNRLELVAVCQVNVPGFPVARACVAGGQVMALVAAGARTLAKQREDEVLELRERITAIEQREFAARQKELASRKAELSKPFLEIQAEKQRRLEAAALAAREPFQRRKQELSSRAEEITKKFAEFKLGYEPDFKEKLHPRDDEGKFRFVLGKLSELLKGPDAPEGAHEAQQALEEAAKAEDAGDNEKAKGAAHEAKRKLQDVISRGDSPMNDKLSEVSDDIDRVAESTGGDKKPDDAPKPDGAPKPQGDAPAPAPKPKAPNADPAPDKPAPSPVKTPEPKPDAPKPGAADELSPEEFAKALDDLMSQPIPPAIDKLFDMFIDEVGEGFDPSTIISRLDNKVRHWLEGKGFQNPEQMAQAAAKILQRKLQPGIGQ